jgi:hypothetical protein
MPIREFTDSAGVKWRVWSTVPAIPTAVDEDLRAGWLTFQCESARKRLSPIPEEWEEATAERLDEMCRRAEVARRTGVTPDPDFPEAPR